jgi:hypothetical protein
MCFHIRKHFFNHAPAQPDLRSPGGCAIQYTLRCRAEPDIAYPGSGYTVDGSLSLLILRSADPLIATLMDERAKAGDAEAGRDRDGQKVIKTAVTMMF